MQDAFCQIERRPLLTLSTYRGTPPTRKCTPLGAYRRPVPRVLGASSRGLGVFSWGRHPCTTYDVVRIRLKLSAHDLSCLHTT